MTEAEVFESVREALASRGSVTPDILRLVEEGLQRFPAEAEPYLRKALELGGGRSAEEALARVLAQLAEPRTA